MNIKLLNGDNIELLKTLKDNSVDSIVTDPPYGLSFMGKKWDYDVPTIELWKECLRVLKPGGHLLAFSGTRTQHRMAVRIEDAGFEIRDMIAWVYGSGFPKSLDVSKAIDKLDASEERRYRNLLFTEWMRSTGLSCSEINKITGTNMGSHYLTDKEQPAVATRELFEILKPFIKIEIPDFIESLIDERTVESKNMKERDVIGKSKNFGKPSDSTPNCANGEWEITKPKTHEAQQWEGWGTALKPALEPITVARKPFKRTVADNVLKYGTGALNIDGCRVGSDGGCSGAGDGARVYGNGLNGSFGKPVPGLGRWPANFIHDGSEEVQDILGNQSRFFYCAKASKKDRDEGLDGFKEKQKAAAEYRPSHLEKANNGESGNPYGRFNEIKNIHPTVKPTELMRYLCRLVTPPGGTVLDPFMGSGSTGKAAMLEGFNFLGMELDDEYFNIAKARIESAKAKKEEK